MKKQRKSGAKVGGVSVDSKVLRIPLKLIRVYKDQPRKYFGQKRLANISASIATSGQKVPAIVHRLPKPDEEGHIYELVSGESRYYACNKAGTGFLLAQVVPIKDAKEQFELSLIENMCRNDLTALEMANAIDRLKKDGKSIAQIAAICGYTTPQIWNYHSLLSLPAEVQKLLDPELDEDKRITFTTALLLVNVPSKQLQISLAKTISRNSLSLSRAKLLVDKTLGRKSIQKKGWRPGKDVASLNAFSERSTVFLKQYTGNNFERLKLSLKGKSNKERYEAQTKFSQLALVAVKVLEFLKEDYG